MHLPRSPRRRTAVWAAAAITATAALSGPAPAFAQSAADPSPVTAKVDSAVLDTVAKGKESTFFVVLKSQADLSAAKGKKSHAAKAKSAFASLRSEAKNSQKPLQSFLDKEKVGYRSYWIANALKVTGGENLVDALAKRPDVASIVKEHTYKLDGTESKSSDAATDAVDAAVAASVVAERPVVVGGRPLPGLAFRHPLVRLTCYDGLSAARRRQLHSAYAEAVLRRRPDAVDTLASHLTRADDPRATQYLRQAAERAAALCANDTADRYYGELTARLDAMAADAAQARIDRGAVLRRMARYQEAATVLREALADMVRRGDEDGQVLAAARLTEVLAKHRGTDEGEELLRTYPPGPHTPPPTTATHHLAAAVVRFVGGRYEAAHASAQRAQEAAEAVRGSERRGLLARSLGSQATALGLAGRFAQARAAADLALPHAEAYGDQELLVTILSVLREHARRSGRLGEAVSIGRQALSLAEHTGDPTTVAFERANLAELHLLLREFAEAREQAEAAVRDGEPSPAWCTPYALAALARVRISTGEPGAAELLARAGRTAEAQRDRQAVHEVRTADAERLVREGRPQEALTLLADDSDPSAAPLLAWAELLSGHPERAARRAAAETLRAARVGERLSETESRTVHAAALAALGRERAAHEEFERAATLARELPYPAGAFAVDEAGGTDWTARAAPPD
ncbi:hypothetical protein [Streptomyces sp. NPDC005096]|uniref:hypothetical protein n=1 Tax=Streptomyces sp. NPDC005096 TaxID=3154559 RepID=UPI0033A48203